MPEYYYLRKTVPVNTFIEMESDRYWVIQRLGTNISGRVDAEVDGIPVVAFHNLLAPMARTNDNLFGPLNLGDHYIVVPPLRKLYFRSATSGLVFVEGRLVKLLPGESIPADHLARYNAYASRKLEYYDYTVTIGTTMLAGREYDVASITPPAIEEHTLRYIAGASISGTATAIGYGQVAVKLYYDGKPLDQLAASVRYHGLDILKMPLPPRAAAEFEPFSFADLPISIPGGHNLKVVAVNVSGADISAATGTNITVRFMALYDRVIRA